MPLLQELQQEAESHQKKLAEMQTEQTGSGDTSDKVEQTGGLQMLGWLRGSQDKGESQESRQGKRKAIGGQTADPKRPNNNKKGQAGAGAMSCM